MNNGQTPDNPDSTTSVVPRGDAGKWLPGKSPNPGGRKRTLVAFEKMLDREHRNVANLRELFARLKALAMGEVIRVVDDDGEVSIGLKSDPAFMKLYLDRVIGPVRDRADLAEELVELMRAATDQELEVLIAIKRRLGT